MSLNVKVFSFLKKSSISNSVFFLVFDNWFIPKFMQDQLQVMGLANTRRVFSFGFKLDHGVRMCIFCFDLRHRLSLQSK